MHKPAEFGYRMPAEWEKHEATWIAWPHRKKDWPAKFEPTPWVIVEIIRAIVRSEKARVVVRNAQAKIEAKKFLQISHVPLDKVEFWIIPNNRAWMRDSGPVFIKNKTTKAMIDWRFNGWGKYNNHSLDNQIPTEINKAFKLPIFKPPYVMEGGAIEVDGKGALIATEECLLSDVQQRNKNLKRDDYEKIFADYLNIRKVIWLDKGIVGDDTHGHVDDITRFANNKCILTVIERNRKDENYTLLQTNLKRLKKTGSNIIELPMPRPVIFDGQRLPASYANFLITNNSVLVPIFGDVEDKNALNLIAEAFSNREIIPIYCRDLVLGLGTIHCLTQQEPA